MSISDHYQDFGPGLARSSAAQPAEEDAQEEVRLQAFENGYQAGWDDADKAHQTARDSIASDFAQNLQDMTFTHVEAYAKLCLAMRPLVAQLVTKLLPEVAQKALGAHVFQQISELIDAQAENAIEIAVSPDNLPSLRDLMDEALDIPFAIVEEPSLGPGQVYLRVNATEREIDLDAVQRTLSDAIDAFFQQVDQEPSK